LRKFLIASLLFVVAPSLFAQLQPVQVSMSVTGSPGPIGTSRYDTQPLMTWKVVLTNSNNIDSGEFVFEHEFAKVQPYNGQDNVGNNISASCAVGASNYTTGFKFASRMNIPANGTCTIQGNIIAYQLGTITETIPAGSVAPPNIPANATAASATFSTAVKPLPLSMTLGASEPNVGKPISLHLELRSVSGASVENIAFTVNYPSGLVNAPSPNATSNVADAVITATPGAGSVSFSNGFMRTWSHTLGMITLDLNLVATQPGNYTVTVPGSSISGDVRNVNEGRTSVSFVGSSASIAIADSNRPIITKAFSPSSVFPLGLTDLKITMRSAADPLNTNGFIDTYPAGMKNAGPIMNPCGWVVSAPLGAGSVSILQTNLTSTPCTITIPVRAPLLPGNYTNTIPAGAVSVMNTGLTNTAAASATLEVTLFPSPLAASAFWPASIAPEGQSRLRVTLTNPNEGPLSGAFINNSYPSGLKNAGDPSAESTCGGTVSAAPNGSGFTLSGGSVPANGNCVVSVFVTANEAGTYRQTLAGSGYGAANARAATAPAASATLTVTSTPPLAVAMAFDTDMIVASNPATLTITLSNPGTAPSEPLTFIDTYPLPMRNASQPNATTTCSAGTLLAAAEGGALQANGIVVPAKSTCTIAVDVTVPKDGTFENQLTVNESTTSAVLQVLAPARRRAR